jgi:nucleotide-binding universal stress UspA family protein
MTRHRRILAPTDFSRPSARAVAKAVELARGSRGQLMLVHVLAPVVPLMGDGYIPPSTYEQIDEAHRRDARRRLTAAAARAARGGARVTTLMLDGIAAEQIARAAKRRRADLIVMGTHGRTGFTRFLLGSVAQRVLTMAPCDVLTVH